MEKYIKWHIVLDGDVDEYEAAYQDTINEIVERIAEDLREGYTSGTVYFDLRDAAGLFFCFFWNSLRFSTFLLTTTNYNFFYW